MAVPSNRQAEATPSATTREPARRSRLFVDGRVGRRRRRHASGDRQVQRRRDRRRRSGVAGAGGRGCGGGSSIVRANRARSSAALHDAHEDGLAARTASCGAGRDDYGGSRHADRRCQSRGGSRRPDVHRLRRRGEADDRRDGADRGGARAGAPHGVHDSRAARSRVRHHVVQLAAEHGGAQGRAGARVRQHRCRQTAGRDAIQRDAPVRVAAGGRVPARHTST